MLDVYRTFYQLTGEPFRLSPDHRFSLGHRSYANAKAYVDYALLQGEGFVAITGAPGTGKTTLIKDVLAGFEETDLRVAMITSTQLESRDLLHMVAHAFDVHPEDRSKANLLLELESFLNKQSYRGHRAILIVDEAQNLSPLALEELRLLANLQRNDQLLLQIFLVGQRKLLDLIRAPGMEQLQQRLVAAAVLEPLDLDGVVDYVEHRLRRVAWRGDPAISEEALRLVHRYSGGIPRRVNVICNRLFLYGGMQEKHELGGDDARAVIEELQQEFLLPAESPGEPEDQPGGEAERSTGSTKTPQRSLPRGETSTQQPSKSADQRQPPRRHPPRRPKKTKARPRPQQAEAARPTPEPTKRDVAPALTELDTVSVAKPDVPPARKEVAAGPRKARYRGIVAAALFLLMGSLFAGILATDSMQGLLRVVGLGESRDSSSATLKTGVHKAIEVHREREKRISLDAQGQQAGSGDTEGGTGELAQDQRAVGDASRLASSPVRAAAEGEEPTHAARNTEAAPDPVTDSSDRPESGSIEQSDDGVRTVSGPPLAPAETLAQGTETKTDRQVASPAIEAEYRKLRRVAGERFSERKDQNETEAETAAPSPRTPPSEPIVASTSFNPAPQAKPSGIDSSASRLAAPAPSLPEVSSSTASAPKASETKVSTPKVSEPKVSVPKVSTSERPEPKVVTAEPSKPKVSVPKLSKPAVSPPEPVTAQPAVAAVSKPKVSQSKTSQPKIAVASATAPEAQAQKRVKSLKKIKPTLLEGQWTSQGKPASLLPSEITFCNSQGDDRIGCWSTPQNVKTKYGPALYKVETTLKGFSAGSFKLSYRTLVKLLDADASARAQEMAAYSEDGWQASEHAMQCQLTKPDTVLCRDQKGVTRKYRRQGPVRRN